MVAGTNYSEMLALKRLNQSLGFKAMSFTVVRVRRLVSRRIQALFDHSKSVDYITTLSQRPAVWSPWSMARFLSKRSWEVLSNESII
ncbi:hypothetical protein BDV39DRAFT_183307, partial [Aspergillus sergii]